MKKMYIQNELIEAFVKSGNIKILDSFPDTPEKRDFMKLMELLPEPKKFSPAELIEIKLKLEVASNDEKIALIIEILDNYEIDKELKLILNMYSEELKQISQSNKKS